MRQSLTRYPQRNNNVTGHVCSVLPHQEGKRTWGTPLCHLVTCHFSTACFVASAGEISISHGFRYCYTSGVPSREKTVFHLYHVHTISERNTLHFFCTKYVPSREKPRILDATVTTTCLSGDQYFLISIPCETFVHFHRNSKQASHSFMPALVTQFIKVSPTDCDLYLYDI